MPEYKCFYCDGTGFVGPKNEPNTPIELMKVGCCNCTACNGSGKAGRFQWDGLDDALRKALKESATNYEKR